MTESRKKATPMPDDKELVVSSVTVSVEVPAPRAKVFAAAADETLLPRWTHPVKAVRMKDGRRQVDYMLPDGTVAAFCDAHKDPERGIVDWTVHLPGADPVQVYSRVIGLGERSSVYVFTLLSPPMPRRRLKDAYGTVEKNLQKDLEKFRDLAVSERREPAGRR